MHKMTHQKECIMNACVNLKKVASLSYPPNMEARLLGKSTEKKIQTDITKYLYSKDETPNHYWCRTKNKISQLVYLAIQNLEIQKWCRTLPNILSRDPNKKQANRQELSHPFPLLQIELSFLWGCVTLTVPVYKSV